MSSFSERESVDGQKSSYKGVKRGYASVSDSNTLWSLCGLPEKTKGVRVNPGSGSFSLLKIFFVVERNFSPPTPDCCILSAIFMPFHKKIYRTRHIDGFVKSRIQSMCHFDRREKSYVFSKLYRRDFSLSAVVAEATTRPSQPLRRSGLAKSARSK